MHCVSPNSHRTSMFPMFFRFSIFLGLPLLFAASGCTQQGSSAQNVTGKVTLNGNNVGGIVVFHAVADGKKFPAPINLEGTYQAGPPPGSYKVTVEGMKTIDGAASKDKIAPPKDAKLSPAVETKSGVTPPAKYASPQTSELKYDVTSAAQQVFNITLTP